MQQPGAGMRSFVLSLAAMLAFAGTSAAQTNPAGSVTPQVLRGTSADPETKKKPPAVVTVALARMMILVINQERVPM